MKAHIWFSSKRADKGQPWIILIGDTLYAAKSFEARGELLSREGSPSLDLPGGPRCVVTVYSETFSMVGAQVIEAADIA